MNVLRCISMGEDVENWEELLPFAVHAMNTAKHRGIGTIPFRLMFGRESCCVPIAS